MVARTDQAERLAMPGLPPWQSFDAKRDCGGGDIIERAQKIGKSPKREHPGKINVKSEENPPTNLVNIDIIEQTEVSGKPKLLSKCAAPPPLVLPNQ